MNKTNIALELIDRINDTQINIMEMLNNTNAEAKEQFLNDTELNMPVCSYDKLDADKVRRNLEILDHISTEDINLSRKSKELFRMVIDNSVYCNSFALANFEFNNTAGDRSKIAERHKKYNELLFGSPEKDTYMDILSYTIGKIDIDALNSEDKRLYEELMYMLPELPDKGCKLSAPDKEVFSEFRRRALDFYEPLLRHIPDGETFGMEDICGVCREILSAELGGAAEKWQVVYEKERSFASVDQNARRLIFPGRRNIPYYTRKKFISLIIHELGVHFLRELTYDDIAIEPLRTGLPGYEAIDEGIAKAMEQAVTDSYEPSGLIHYISIGLANFYSLSFREIFEIQKRLQKLANGIGEGSVYDSVRRALRGTNVLPNNKDLVYYNGADKVWRYITENIDSPSLFDDLLLSGKTDIFDPKHRSIVYELKTGCDFISR